MVYSFIKQTFLNSTYVEFRKKLINTRCYIGKSDIKTISGEFRKIAINNLYFHCNNDQCSICYSFPCFLRAFIIFWEENSYFSNNTFVFYISCIALWPTMVHYRIIFQNNCEQRFKISVRYIEEDRYENVFRKKHINKSFLSIGEVIVFIMRQLHISYETHGAYFFNKTCTYQYTDCEYQIKKIRKPWMLSELCSSIIHNYYKDNKSKQILKQILPAKLFYIINNFSVIDIINKYGCE